MEPTTYSTQPRTSCAQERSEEEEREIVYSRYADAILSLPADDRWLHFTLRQYQGFWFLDRLLPGIMAAQDQFRARPTDILLATNPRSGTTWFKALIFSTATRSAHNPSSPSHPLVTHNPHALVPFLEYTYSRSQSPDLDSLPSPRLLSTHAPYSILPTSVTDDGCSCKIVCVARNLKANLVSQWRFLDEGKLSGADSLPLGRALELYLSGVSIFGPATDHVLGYWEESLRRPDKVLFLRYEDVKADTVGNLKRLAAFLGCPFSEDEERLRVAEEIATLCSFENLKKQEVNRSGVFVGMTNSISNKAFFRKAEEGEWADHLTPEMASRVDDLVEQKLRGTGLELCTVDRVSVRRSHV